MHLLAGGERLWGRALATLLCPCMHCALTYHVRADKDCPKQWAIKSVLLRRAKNEPYIASMGIYVLKASAIRDLLSKHFPEVCHSNLLGM